jgi:cyclic lactone autoinducer peptide
MAFFSSCAVLALVALHVGGVAAAWATRALAGSRAEGFTRCVFLLGMTAVGCCAWYYHQPESGFELPSGMTVVAMMLLAIVDLRRTHEPAHMQSRSHTC